MRRPVSAMPAVPTALNLSEAFTRPGSRVEPPSRAAAAAAVALVFRERNSALSLCIGRRARVAGDPWSGDFAFPGGKPEAEDGCMHDVAARETREEVGLVLPRTALLGDLGVIQAGRGPGRAPLPVCPLVYLLDAAPGPFALDHELVAAYWVPVATIWNAENWIAFDYRIEGRLFSGIRVEDHFIWGFTLRVIMALGTKLRTPLTKLLNLKTLPKIDGRIFDR